MSLDRRRFALALAALGGLPLAGAQSLVTQDGTDYFDVHHTENDTLDKVSAQALPQNVAAWAVVAWLAAQSDVRF